MAMDDSQEQIWRRTTELEKETGEIEDDETVDKLELNFGRTV